jgi:radical SAM protein with 4Fe4S-binding SPASM domain
LNTFKYIIRLWKFSKLLNFLVVTSSYYISKLFGKVWVWGHPYISVIEPTALCNLQCPQCPVGAETLTRPQNKLSVDDFNRYLSNVSDYSWFAQLYFQGESLLHPEIVSMINNTYDKKLAPIIYTNGTPLANPKLAEEIVNSNLAHLVFSIDGASEDTYKIYRKGGNFKQVLKAVTNVMEAKKRKGSMFPIVHWQFIVMRHNEHEIDRIKQIGKELGVDKVILKSPQVYDFENAEEILPGNKTYRRYEKSNGSYKLAGSFTGYCKKIWFTTVITWDGKVIPCCYDKDAEHVMNNVNEEVLSEIWQNSSYRSFRNAVVKNRSKIPICNNCAEGLKTFYS